MKILIIDRNGFQLQTRKMLIENELECSVDTASTVGELYVLFKKEVYSVVIIDHTIENGQVYMDYIVQNDPMQAVLVVSDAIHCVFSRCDDCVENHLSRRLFNPTPIKNIVRMLKGFHTYKCDHYDAETNGVRKIGS